ncbi:hypothetical protein M569_08358, partial [Genlisea aurea]
MGLKKLLLLLKPLDIYPSLQLLPSSPSSNFDRHRRILSYLHDRTSAHKNAISICQNILKKKSIDFEAIFRNDLHESIRDVDLVISVGGDGTLLQAGHLINDSTPVLGVNSDPTRPEEVAEFSDEFDATRSTGYLCAATASNLEEILDGIIAKRSTPSELARIAIRVNAKLLSISALNDVLLAHPSPAAVSRFSFRVKKRDSSPLIHCRSSGLRVSTAAGSTAAMLSAGGYPMPILSKELQYMVRESISPPPSSAAAASHGSVKPDEKLDVTWFSGQGALHIDGSHVVHHVRLGDSIHFSSAAPPLNVYL